MNKLLPASIRQKLRRQYPGMDKIAYFNTGSHGAWPKSSQDLMIRHAENWTKMIDPTSQAWDDWRECKDELAKMVNADANDIGFAFNTSHGLNIAAAGIDFKRGDQILLSDIEFPANTYPWTNLKYKGVKVKFLKSKNGFFDIDSFEKSITKKTRLFSISWVQYFNGYRNDIERLGRICQKHNVFFVVDGIQGVGNIPIDVKKCKIDLLAGGAQKWLLSPVGCGFFYLNPKAKLDVRPVFSGWFGYDWEQNWTDLQRYDLESVTTAERFAISAFPYALMHSMLNSIKMINSIGIDSIHSHNLKLIDKVAQYIDGHRYFKLISSMVPEHRSSIISIACKDVIGLHGYLTRRKIITSYREGLLRMSFELYNNLIHVDRLIKSLDIFASKHIK
jgi:selenocysteine lyase/cysteine desulfurase